jgi:Ca-activated chloride channel family protein
MGFDGGEAMSNTLAATVRLNHSWLGSASILLLALVLLPINAFGQSPFDNVHITPRTPLMAAAEPGAAERGATASAAIRTVIRKSADLVLVPVSVTDPRGRLMTGLSPSNFQVFENKKPQEIKHFSSEDTPVSLSIIVDTSGSMSTKMERVREAVKQFRDLSNPQDEFFMITFSDVPQLVQDFGDPSENIANKLPFANPKGRTTLLDAIYMGILNKRDAKYGRKALLIISDGGDNHSRYREGELKSAVKESDIMIYAIGIFVRYVSTAEEMLGPQLLFDIADVTGGRAFILDNPIEMPVLARRIGMELRTQYVLGYRPNNPPHDGKWRKIIVKLKLPKKIDYLRARAKEGILRGTVAAQRGKPRQRNHRCNNNQRSNGMGADRMDPRPS